MVNGNPSFLIPRGHAELGVPKDIPRSACGASWSLLGDTRNEAR